MQQILTYLYPNLVEVQIWDTSIFKTRNRVVYSRPIKVYQGIDNPLQIVVRNQDQKSVDLTGYLVEAQIQDPVNQLTVNSYAVIWTDITKGYGNFVIDKACIDDLEQRLYKLTFKTIRQSDDVEGPMYIDDNYGVPLDLMVLPAYWSNIQPAPNIEQSVVDGGYL